MKRLVTALILFLTLVPSCRKQEEKVPEEPIPTDTEVPTEPEEPTEPAEPLGPEVPDDAKPQEPARTEAFDIELVFLPEPGATAFQWPFATPLMSEISASYSVGKASFPGQKTALALPEAAGGYTFQIYATTGVARNGGSSQGFKFGGATGDCLQLPAIKGLYLTRVTWVSGGASAAELVRYDDVPVNGGGPIPGGNVLGKGNAHIWMLYGSEKETAYKIRTVSSSVVQAQQILLHYDVTPLDSAENPSTQFQEVLPDEIPDFSRVGYHWGDRPIPDVPVKMTLEAPAGGADALELIQNAINTVETPGAIFLKAGTYPLSGILQLNRSGVVLRGEGEDKTILYSTATTQQTTLVQMGSTGKLSVGSASMIIAKYVPVGQMWVPVRDPGMFSVGERVWIYRPATEAWLDALHMRELAALYPGRRDWTTTDYSMFWERKIMKIEGNRIWFDNPVVMCVGGDESYGDGYLCKGNWPRIEECGIENLSLDTRYDGSKKNGDDFIDEDHCWSGITVYAVEHGWIRNVTTRHFGLSSVSLNTGAKNITVKKCTALVPVSSVEGDRRYAFHMEKAQLCLVEDCLCDDDRHQYVTGGRVPGPNVFLRCTGTRSRSDAGPHQRWATGVLFDNVKVTGPIDVQDRGGMGGGHGWSGVNFVCYNCETTSTICIQSPWVTGQNWAIGCVGTKVRSAAGYADNLGIRPDGIWQSRGTHVTPESLYEDQLEKRHAQGEYIDK